jgi:hypothetical protein
MNHNFGTVSCAIDDVRMVGGAKVETARLVLKTAQVQWYAVTMSSVADNHLGGTCICSSTMAKHNTWYSRYESTYKSGHHFHQRQQCCEGFLD